MKYKEREQLNQYTQIRTIGLRIASAFQQIKESRKMLAAVLVLTALMLLCIANAEKIILAWVPGVTLTKGLSVLIFKVATLMMYFVLLSVISRPLESYRQERAFKRIGFVNKAQEQPILLHVERCQNCSVYEYDTAGIPLLEFIDSQAELESALNLSIISITQGKNKRRVRVKAMSGNVQLPTLIPWEDSYLPKKSADIVLGMSLFGPKIVNLDVSPHFQVGGMTGCGKTKLMEHVLYQMKAKGAEVYLYDHKGFLDFTKSERAAYHCLSSLEDLDGALLAMVKTLESRKRLFAETECNKITEYNKKHPERPRARIMLATDEAAQIFDKSGLSKEEKALVEQITSKMKLIAQQGRFAGMHLWLSTQRGDAETIPAQIRSNLTTKICGRAGDTLSRVTVGHELAKEIPAEYRGRFVDDMGEFFQGFWFDGRL